MCILCVEAEITEKPTIGIRNSTNRNLIQLKALWGGHTAALQFMLCIQFPIGEGKHAIRSRRLHEDEIVTACTAGNSTEMVLICLYVGLPKHVLHELSLLKHRVRRTFLHKMRPDAMQKMEISLRSHAIKQTMLNVASEKGLLTKHTHFSNGVCNFQVAISGAKRVHRGIIGRPKRHIFHDFAFVPLSKSCFPPRAGSIFQKIG